MSRSASGLLFVAGVTFGGATCTTPDPYPDGLYAEIETPKGQIVLRLDSERTPMTVASFVGLAEGTVENDAFEEGEPFFDGSSFHRVVPGHVIQGGRPDSDMSDSSGHALPNEIHPELGHGRAGMLGMANGGPHTATNQFYITLGDRSYLDGNYTVFGEVFEGMDVVQAIEKDDAIETFRIVRIGETAHAFRPDTEQLLDLMAEVAERNTEQEAARRNEEQAYVQERWPDAVATESDARYVVVEAGEGPHLSEADIVSVRYVGHTVDGLMFRSTGVDGMPNFAPDAEAGDAFDFELGATTLNPGLDEAVSDMTVGEKRIVILLPDIAYAERGYFAPDEPGKKRFVISPNRMLIYEIEVLESR